MLVQQLARGQEEDPGQKNQMVARQTTNFIFANLGRVKTKNEMR